MIVLQIFFTALFLFTISVGALTSPSPFHPRNPKGSFGRSCRRTRVAVLGAGVAGINAAKALSDCNVNDFLILEYNSEIGGRCRHTKFGEDKDGNPYVVELGANWVQGTVTDGSEGNPIWSLVQENNVTNQLSDPTSIQIANAGVSDFLPMLDEFNKALTSLKQDQRTIHEGGNSDEDLSSALKRRGWDAGQDPTANAIEWYHLDYEYAQHPLKSSRKSTIANSVSTFDEFSSKSHMSLDQRGFNSFIHGQASEFLQKDDDRLLLNTVVRELTWTNENVIIDNVDGSCVEAEYAITTFSVGVLQFESVTFNPPLPASKLAAINKFQMGTYTKIFLQFPADQVFWNRSTEFFLHASPTRGYYPVWQSLDHDSFLPASGILFVTVVADQAYEIEAQDDDITKAQVLQVLRAMFGAENVLEPTAFMYPRWSTTPWAYGAFSNWPPGFTSEEHRELRTNNGRIWYAGEAYSEKYHGYLQGAYFEGKQVGETVARCLSDAGSVDCGSDSALDSDFDVESILKD